MEKYYALIANAETYQLAREAFEGSKSEWLEVVIESMIRNTEYDDRSMFAIARFGHFSLSVDVTTWWLKNNRTDILCYLGHEIDPIKIKHEIRKYLYD